MKKLITESEFKKLIQQGIKDFSGYTMNVTMLYCSSNQLTSLPELPNVTELYCSYNQLTALPNYTNSATSGRSVVYMNGKILTRCYCGTVEEFYQKGFIIEGKQWVADFCEKLKQNGLIQRYK